MLVYVLKKKKRENMQHMTSGTHTINWSSQLCVDVTPPPRIRAITPSGSRTRVSGAGGGRSGTPKATVSSVSY